MADWNQDLNPIPAEGKFYLKHFKEQATSEGNPVEDLTDIMLDCYELLTTISKNYTPTGDKRQDSSVQRLKELFVHWTEEDLEIMRENAAMDRKRPTHAPPPPPTPSVFEPRASDMDTQADIRDSYIEKQVEIRDSGGIEKKVEIETPVASSTRSSQSSIPTTRESSDGSAAQIPKSSSTPSLSAIKDDSDKNAKNNDYFLKLKEDEALAKKKQEEEESKMKPEALKKLQEERRLAEEHDSSKTAHLSKLGSKYMPAKKKTSTGEIILERGGAGRGRGGRGGGRGGH